MSRRCPSFCRPCSRGNTSHSSDWTVSFAKCSRRRSRDSCTLSRICDSEIAELKSELGFECNLKGKSNLGRNTNWKNVGRTKAKRIRCRWGFAGGRRRQAMVGYGLFAGEETKVSIDGWCRRESCSLADFYNWNRVFVRYCDGASFLGDTEADDHGHLVQLRGSKIWSAVMDELLQVKGLNKAENVMLSGSSAGGLSVLLNCDAFEALLPNAKKVKCLADSGFFVQAKALPNAYIKNTFEAVIEFRNLTEFLPKSCTAKMNASLCMFPEFFVDDIKTPHFILNSAYDSFQVQHLQPEKPDDVDWGTKCTNSSSEKLPLPRPSICTPSQMKIINDLRGAFLDAVDGLADVPSRGIYIDACYNHVYTEVDTMWGGETLCKLENKTVSQAVGDWYFDRSPVKLIDRESHDPLNCNAALYGNL